MDPISVPMHINFYLTVHFGACRICACSESKLFTSLITIYARYLWTIMGLRYFYQLDICKKTRMNYDL